MSGYNDPDDIKWSAQEIAKALDKRLPTLRDQFATTALNALIQCFSPATMAVQWDGLAKDAYDAADAMLKARETK